ncbi:hypothetical protein PINS_up017197 [Pythium insidiosum]|nr:hypothetical protein PINS_up017197 [Pythium insidiosum]
MRVEQERMESIKFEVLLEALLVGIATQSDESRRDEKQVMPSVSPVLARGNGGQADRLIARFLHKDTPHCCRHPRACRPTHRRHQGSPVELGTTRDLVALMADFHCSV